LARGNHRTTAAVDRAHLREDRRPVNPAGVRLVGLAAAVCVVLAGCGGAGVSSEEELIAFSQAGPVQVKVDLGELYGTGTCPGSYRVVPGDVLELSMPVVLNSLPESANQAGTHLCRVDEAGNIVLPIVGEVPAVGRTMSEIEAAATALYFPKYVRQKPSIVAKVAEHHSAVVSVVGGVKEPGAYELRSNEMTLVCALMKAGGIAEQGATAIYIRRAGQDQALKIPVVGMNVVAGNPELADGDSIVVEALEPQVIAVIGLVKNPGLFPCSPKQNYSVMDALAFAGGVDDLADPQYVKVYRQDASGEVISAVLKLEGPSGVGASRLRLKPGDVIAVEQSPRTRARVLLAQIVRVGVGVNSGASFGN